MKGIELFIQRLQNRGVTATSAMIEAVNRNNGIFWLEKNRKFLGGFGEWVERYPTEHWAELSDTSHLKPNDWHQLGMNDRSKGLAAMSDNPSYLLGYGEIKEQQAA